MRVCLARSGSDCLFPSLGVTEKVISTLALQCLRNSCSFSEDMHVGPSEILCAGVSCFPRVRRV